MIAHIARRELLGHLRGARFLALSAMCVTLLATGAYVDARRFEDRVAYGAALEAQRQAAIALERRGDAEATISRYGWHTGRSAADPALRAVRPPAPTSVLAVGNDLVTPAFWQFDTEGLTAGTAADDATSARGATLDFEFIARAVLSLVALLLAADAFAGERESGVIRTLLAAPVSRLDVLLGKCLGGLLTLCVPLVLGGMATGIVLTSLGVPLVDRDVWPRALLLTLGTLLYLSTVFVFGAGVSAGCREARTATVILVAAWVLAVVVLPGATSLVAAVMRPVLPAELVRQHRVDALAQLELERAHVLARVWRAAAGTDDVPTDRALTDDARRRYDDLRRAPEATLMARKRAVVGALDDEQSRARTRRDRLAALLGAISPASVYARFAADAAGTGTALADRWERAARTHQRRLELASFDRPFGAELFDARASYLRITVLPGPEEHVPAYAELPAFAAPRPDLRADVRAALPPLALLAAQHVVVLGLAAAAVARMEV